MGTERGDTDSGDSIGNGATLPLWLRRNWELAEALASRHNMWTEMA